MKRTSLLSTDVCWAPIMPLILEIVGAAAHHLPCTELKPGSRIHLRDPINGMWWREGVRSPKQACDRDMQRLAGQDGFSEAIHAGAEGSVGGHSLGDGGAEGVPVLGFGSELCAVYELYLIAYSSGGMNHISSFPRTCQPARNDNKDHLDISLSSSSWITWWHKIELTFLQSFFFSVFLCFSSYLTGFSY